MSLILEDSLLTIPEYLEEVLCACVSQGASDIHFESNLHGLIVRYRRDGHMYDLHNISESKARGAISRLKVLSGLDIAQKGVAQDGRMNLLLGNKTVSFRIATVPTQYGESIVLRVLDRYMESMDLGGLGMTLGVQQKLKSIVAQPNGMLLVVGPTGSGKTTTLYSLLNLIDRKERKVMSVEDPVEYDLDGVQQVMVEAGLGLNFKECLRAFLRQDPDVMMVGEIRDGESARMSLQASLTGHLVLSSLHAKDAPCVVARLVDMGIEYKLLPATLKGVLAQRLVRLLCPCCKIMCQVEPELLDRLGLDRGREYFKARGCEVCVQTGYEGRIGVFEYMEVGKEIGELILKKASDGEIRTCARELGMSTMKEEACRLFEAGETSLAEISKLIG